MLKITNITLRNFRSYRDYVLTDVGDLTIIVGPNASGKTNAVEAIQLLTALSSFRSSLTKDLVLQGETFAHASMDVEDEHRQLEIALRIVDGKRTFTLNGKAKQPKDLRGILPSVIFTPDDLGLVKGSDRYRRHELDMLGAQLNANYYQIIHDFEKILRHKNKLLKDGAPIDLVAAINEMYIKVAQQFTNYRMALFERLLPKIKKHYEEISLSKETLEGEYLRSWESEQKSFDQAVFEALAEETQRQHALVGPHLDKVNFSINGLDARAFASQGQQRSIVLALKLAEAEIIEEMMDQLPVLLLDDVMSELDGARREALVEKLLAGKQTFITTANINYFDKHMLDQAKVVELE